MAHTYGTATAHTSSASNPIITSVTINPGDTVLVLMLKVRGATNRTGGAPTIDGVSLAQAGTTQKAATSPEASAEIWYVTNPKVGTRQISIPNSGGQTIYYRLCTARAADGRISEFDVAGGSNGTSTNPGPGNITPTRDGAVLFAVVATGATTWAPSARAGTQIGDHDDGADGTGYQYYLQATAAAFNLNWTFATSDDWGCVVAAFVEYPAIGMNNYTCCIEAGSGMAVTERLR